jgi:hypothetical protein
MDPQTTTTDDTATPEPEPTTGHTMNITVQGITITCRSEQDVLDVCEALGYNRG